MAGKRMDAPPTASARIANLKRSYAELFNVRGNSWEIGTCIYEIQDENGGRGVFEMPERSYGRASSMSVLKVVGMYAYPEGKTPPSREAMGECYKLAKREAELMGLLKGQPHIVQMFDYAICDWKLDGWRGKDLLVQMEYLPQTLEDTVRKLRSGAAYDKPKTLKVGIDLCDALVECSKSLREQGEDPILHRDVKPANVFYDGKKYKLGDFGISRFLETQELAQTKELTASYAAPERLSGLAYDWRADIYSVGLILFVLCNDGRFPYEGMACATTQEESTELIRRRCVEGLPAPRRGGKNMRSVIQVACMKDPKDRFGSFEEMKEALLKASRSDSATAPEQSAKPSEEGEPPPPTQKMRSGTGKMPEAFKYPVPSPVQETRKASAASKFVLGAIAAIAIAVLLFFLQQVLS